MPASSRLLPVRFLAPLLMLFAGLCHANQPAAPDFFGPATPVDPSKLPGRPPVRSSAAKVRSKLFLNPQAKRITVRLNLFPNVNYVVTFKRGRQPSKGTDAWYGYGENAGFHSATMVVRSTPRPNSDDETSQAVELRGVVYTKTAVYSFEPYLKNPGLYVIRQLATYRFTCRPLTPPARELQPPERPVYKQDEPIQVDVAFFYAEKAFRDASGSHSLMRLKIDNSLAVMNQALVDGKVNVHLVAVGKELALDEVEEDWSSLVNLEELADPTDGQWDAIHGRRTALKADLVCLIVGRGGSRAYLMGTPSHGFRTKAFSVVSYHGLDHAIMAHELGHNFGCCHRQGNAGTACQAHARAWWFEDSSNKSHGTIVATARDHLIPTFSNPTVGNANTNNQKVLADAAETVSLFY